MNSMRKGVYYTSSALLSNVNANLTLKSKPIQRLARKPISDITAQLSIQHVTVLNEADLKLASKNIIYVMNSGGRLYSSNAARLLAIQSAQSGRSVVLCDTTGQIEKEIKEKTTTEEAAFPIHNISDSLSVITGADGGSFFTSKTFNATIKDLAGRFDQIFICTSNRNSLPLPSRKFVGVSNCRLCT